MKFSWAIVVLCALLSTGSVLSDIDVNTQNEAVGETAERVEVEPAFVVAQENELFSKVRKHIDIEDDANNAEEEEIDDTQDKDATIVGHVAAHELKNDAAEEHDEVIAKSEVELSKHNNDGAVIKEPNTKRTARQFNRFNGVQYFLPKFLERRNVVAVSDEDDDVSPEERAVRRRKRIRRRNTKNKVRRNHRKKHVGNRKKSSRRKENKKSSTKRKRAKKVKTKRRKNRRNKKHQTVKKHNKKNVKRRRGNANRGVRTTHRRPSRKQVKKSTKRKSSSKQKKKRDKKQTDKKDGARADYEQMPEAIQEGADDLATPAA